MFVNKLAALAAGAVLMGTMAQAVLADPPADALKPPPQDQGIPYTRSARATAIAKIKDAIATFPGSRYAYVYGYKVRLDDAHPLAGEAIERDGKLLVPAAFLPALTLPAFNPPPAPEYLKSKWVYSLPTNIAVPTNPKAATFEIAGAQYVIAADAASAGGMKVITHSRGLVLIGKNPSTLGGESAEAIDAIVTLFDTPEKLADPAIATKYIPTLARQGDWTKHIKASPEALKQLNETEVTWPITPKSAYDERDFDRSVLGSRLPPPGVYPRVLFSPEDVPAIAERVKQSISGQMSLIETEILFKQSWWDPNTSDGKIFLKLATGDTADLKWASPGGNNPAPSAVPHVFEGQKPGIFNTHIAYVPECLTAMAMYCLITNDDAHGKQAAAAIANYYRRREPIIDEWNAMSDTEFGGAFTRGDGTLSDILGNGSETNWRGMHGIAAQMDLGLSLDFAGKWMSDADKDTMRRIIAKATYGRRPYSGDGPMRFHDVNWATWDLPYILAVASIEGLEGYDREGYEASLNIARAFLDYGIHPNGYIWESNGKNGAGLRFELLALMTLARRGDNLFGHPHLRSVLTAQAQVTAPNYRQTLSGGTFSSSPMSWPEVQMLKTFYPKGRAGDYLLTGALNGVPLSQVSAWPKADKVDLATFGPDQYAEFVKQHLKRWRMPSVTYPSFVCSILYAVDWKPTTFVDLNLPLDYEEPIHGVLTSRSDNTPDASWLAMLVRPNQYMGAGHHHADAGLFHFGAMGVNWISESPFTMEYAGKLHNQVMIDGKAEPESVPGILGWNAPAAYLGSRKSEAGATASADLSNAYTYRWCSQPPAVWTAEHDAMGWELDPTPEAIRNYQGTQRYKMRPWWQSYTYSNWCPTARALWNPVKYVYRSVALLRGDAPYALIVDDAKKDDAKHLYEWSAMLAPGVWKADVAAALNQTVLAYREPPAMPVPAAANIADRGSIKPVAGEPLLLVQVIAPDASGDASRPLVVVDSAHDGPPARGKVEPQSYDRLLVQKSAVAAQFRVVLIPFRAGQPLPKVTVNADDSASVGGDAVRFTVGQDARTTFEVTRSGKVVLSGR